jgi:hypothetical protein
MIERAGFMATQPGFVSVNLHPEQGRQPRRQLRVVDQRRQARRRASRAGVRKKWPHFGELVKEADPCLYDVVHVEAA